MIRVHELEAQELKREKNKNYITNRETFLRTLIGGNT